MFIAQMKEAVMSVLNIGSQSDDWRAQRLSNFSSDAFVLDGIQLASVEGFIQGTKFPEGDPIREEAFRSSGVIAKRLGKTAERQFVWWGGSSIPFGSAAHHALIERAMRAKFEQNKEAVRALLATEDMEITHILNRPESPHTSLPASVFCGILTRIRTEASQTP